MSIECYSSEPAHCHLLFLLQSRVQQMFKVLLEVEAPFGYQCPAT